MRKLTLLLISSLLLFVGCEDEDEIKNINSFPRWNSSLLNHSEIYLFFTKDLSRAIYAKDQLRPPLSPKQMPAVLKVGGLSTIASYLDIAKEKFGDQSIIISGPPLLEKVNSSQKNTIILSSLAKMPLDAVLLSHYELISSKQTLENEFPIDWLNSNTISIKTTSNTSIWNSLNMRVLDKGFIKIGLVGIAELDSINEAQKKDLQGHYFKGATTAILKLKKKLNSAGSQFNILIYNGKNTCDNKVTSKIMPFSKIEEDTECLKDSPLEKILDQLPPNLIHLVIATKGKFSHARISKTPILGNPDGTLYLSGAKLVFNKSGEIKNKYSTFLAPLKYCQKVFAGLDDCKFTHSNPEHQATRLKHLEKTAFGLIQARFLGKEVRKNELIEAIINGTLETPTPDK